MPLRTVTVTLKGFFAGLYVRKKRLLNKRVNRVAFIQNKLIINHILLLFKKQSCIVSV